jgi:predicted type IV restriction endonuclease/predicted transport protein
MEQLDRAIVTLRSKIDGLRKHGLKETPTRTIVIDPLLEALGWDVRDPDEVQLEYPTEDGKSVDYGLKLNRKCVLLIEAKAFDDPLTDVKAVTQIVNYANSNGIVWCILTNGLTWKVYRSIENCPAPEKLMYEVLIDPRDAEGMSIQQIAQQMWRFSREEIAKGALDKLGEQTFTDSKVRKALDTIMTAAPRSFLNVVREATGDQSITPQQIKESLSRIWRGTAPDVANPTYGDSDADKMAGHLTQAAKPAGQTQRAAKSESSHDEEHHINGKPKEAVELYRAVDRLCLSMRPGAVAKRFKAKHIAYDSDKRSFCSVHINQGGLRVWLRLKYGRLTNPPSFARDVSSVGHWGNGDLELGISSLSQLKDVEPLILQSFKGVRPHLLFVWLLRHAGRLFVFVTTAS